MKGTLRTIPVLLACLFAQQVHAQQIEYSQPMSDSRIVNASVIVCKGLIDDGLFKSIKRRTQTALDSGTDYIIYEISTYGGLLNSADDISKYLILDVGKKAHTIAYITTEAISAGAMISVSCQDIIMRENTTIGDCAPVAMGAKLEGVEREKVESFRQVIMSSLKATSPQKTLTITTWKIKS
jgi:membrane-bound ClpP family serine protease